jgi:DNA-binding NarL/FixJ family response regulator
MNQAAGNTTGRDQLGIFVVERAPEIRKRLVAMIHRVAGIKVVGQGDSVDEATGVIGRGEAQALLVGLQQMGSGDLEALASLKQACPALRAIVLTDSTNPQYMHASRAAGAEFCLDKSREFGLVPDILRKWAEAAGARSSM